MQQQHEEPSPPSRASIAYGVGEAKGCSTSESASASHNGCTGWIARFIARITLGTTQAVVSPWLIERASKCRGLSERELTSAISWAKRWI